MEILNLLSNQLNQNGYSKNMQTKGKIGALFAFPINHTPDDCLSCDGYSLLIVDYKDLYKLLGKTFNKSGDAEGTFRIPDYNVTKRFLQPGSNVATLVEAGLPNITGQYHNVGIEPGGVGVSGSIVNHNWGGSFFYHASGRGSNLGGFDINASRSSAIYGKSSTVQPPSQIIHLCIKYK
ncbi:MAG: tail fiber protein [Bacteroidales bacterium]|nr:tail fiber protein [Bacteroidales bacterium]